MEKIWATKKDLLWIAGYEQCSMVDMDISQTAIGIAAEKSMAKTGGFPNLVICHPSNYHAAESAVSHLGGMFKLLNVVVSLSMGIDEWAVGSSLISDSFFGSVGA